MYWIFPILTIKFPFTEEHVSCVGRVSQQDTNLKSHMKTLYYKLQTDSAYRVNGTHTSLNNHSDLYYLFDIIGGDLKK